MKSLRHFITESVRSYKYTIKIAGDVDKNFIDLFKYNLNKFDPIKVSDPVNTPIQKSPFGFPELKNEQVTIIKAEFRYPATEPMIQQIAQLLGYNINMVRVVTTEFDDSVNSEADQYANQAEHSPLINHEELEDQGKEASQAYGKSYLEGIKKQADDSKFDILYDAPKTPTSYDPFKQPVQDKMGVNSPMSKMTRQPKPETGSSK